MFTFFKPKHTIESVVNELHDGLCEGSIVLRAEGATSIDRKHFLDLLRQEREYYRRRERLMTILMYSGYAIMAVTLIGVRVLSFDVIEHTLGYLLGTLSVFGALLGSLQSKKASERGAELKTYSRVVSTADPEMFKQIVSRLLPKLHRAPAENQPENVGK